MNHRDRFHLHGGGSSRVHPGFRFPGCEQPSEADCRSREESCFDEASRPEFGPIGELFHEHGKVTTEISRRRVEVVGLFHMGASFANSGHLITSDMNFLQLSPLREPWVISTLRVDPPPQPGSAVRKRCVQDWRPDCHPTSWC